MVPNILYYHAIGKIAFCLCDIWTASILRKILKKTCELESDKIEGLVALWALNPLIFNVSTRGNADTMVALMVVGVLSLLLDRSIWRSGMLFGFVVHFKIYPIIYALPIYFWIDMKRGSFFTKRRVQFTLISASTFFAIVGFFYL
jgi:phosphatidylinositol glycan class M